MEFWGVEVKAGEPLKCEPGEDRYVHLSQASLAEFKKDKASEPVRLYVKVGDQKLVLGALSSENCTQISFDLIFEKDFELSHNWKNGSVHFCGYKTVIQEEGPDDSSDSDEEEVPMLLKENGKPQPKEQPKPASENANAAKPEPAAKKVKVVEPKQEEGEDESDDDDQDDDESDDLDMLDAGNESDEDSEEESSDEEDEATPKKSKKRPSEPVSKKPVSEKKAKLTTPTGQKTGAEGKKGGHTATPYPSKQGAKAPAANDKAKQMTPKSGGQFSCKPCNKTFNSENALSSHTKAKHSAGK